MNYENSKSLTDVKFKRLVGVQRKLLHKCFKCLTYAQTHKQGGRTPKLSLEDLLMTTLQYLREYRTYEQVAADFGIHESNLIRRSKWAEDTLIKNGFHIADKMVTSEDTVLVDATEIRVNRPKKTA